MEKIKSKQKCQPAAEEIEQDQQNQQNQPDQHKHTADQEQVTPGNKTEFIFCFYS